MAGGTQNNNLLGLCVFSYHRHGISVGLDIGYIAPICLLPLPNRYFNPIVTRVWPRIKRPYADPTSLLL